MSRTQGLATLRRLAPLLPVGCALFAWAPLLDNYFKGDDFVHLYDLATLPFLRLLLRTWGGHVYTVRNTLFDVMFRLFGTNPRPYFWSVLVTHGLNALLLYGVIRRFAGSVVLACVGATLWAASPVLEEALGWYSVYGQVLLTAILLAVLWSLGQTIVTGAVVTTRSALCWAALLLAGSTCFGIGFGVALVFPLVAAIALPRRQLPGSSLLVLITSAAIAYVYYRLVITYSPDVSGVDAKLFSVTTALRGLPTVLAFVVGLFAFGGAALGFDFVGAHRRFPASMGIVGGTTLLLLVLAGLACSSGATRRHLLALGLLAVAAYGTIAAGRAIGFAVLNTPLWVAVMASRYQYLGLAVVTVLLCTALAQIAALGDTARRVVLATAALWMVVRVAVLVVRPFPIDHSDSERADTMAMLSSIQQQIASTPPGQVVMIENRPFGLSRGFASVYPGWAGMFVVFFPDNTVDGRPVRFLVSEDDWQRAQARDGRIAALVTRR
jgi:hypothetical protein